jgi:hypothetical protein
MLHTIYKWKEVIMFRFLPKLCFAQATFIGGVGLLMFGSAEMAKGSNKTTVTCFPISDPGSDGIPYFLVTLTRMSQDRKSPGYDMFDVSVEKQITRNPPHNFQTIGTYTAFSRKPPNTQSPYFIQFYSGNIREFELGLYETGSLPWADLWMITNTGSNPKEQIIKQLECSIVNV